VTATLIDLDRNPWPKAADKIDELGWIQRDMKNDKGVCLTGAIRECALVPGDWAIIREVANHAALRALGAVVVYGHGDVAGALARRHEIGKGITQADYDLMVKPWVDLFGPMHPEDVTA
jgi:hypothetical protein